MIVDKGKFVSSIGAFIGTIVLLFAVYSFMDRLLFLSNATSLSAPIVAVTYEYVPAGRGSVLAYVPTVQMSDERGKAFELKVDTSNEAPVYAIGQLMQVSCNIERGCIEDTFIARWRVSLFELLISILLFIPLFAWKSGFWQPGGKISDLSLKSDEP